MQASVHLGLTKLALACWLYRDPLKGVFVLCRGEEHLFRQGGTPVPLRGGTPVPYISNIVQARKRIDMHTQLPTKLIAQYANAWYYRKSGR